MHGEGNSIVCGTVAAICKLQRIQWGRQHRADVVSDEFSKHLLKMGVRATGLQSFKHVILFFFGMGTMVIFWSIREPQTERGRGWKCLWKPRLAGMHMLGAHGLGCIRTHSLVDIHPFEGSCYIHDRNGDIFKMFFEKKKRCYTMVTCPVPTIWDLEQHNILNELILCIQL